MKAILLTICFLTTSHTANTVNDSIFVLYVWETSESSPQYLTRYIFKDKYFIKKDTLFCDTLVDHFKEKEEIYKNYIISCNIIFDFDKKKIFTKYFRY